VIGLKRVWRHHSHDVAIGDHDNLSAIPSGESVQIREMLGGHHFLSRLVSLGFTPGTHLKVVQNFGRGPIIVSVRDTRVALGRCEAERILIDRLAREDNGH